MGMLKERYPKNWNKIALNIKEKANWKCQECGRKCRKVGESMEDFVKRISPLPNLSIEICLYPKRFVLTVAHLDHMPENCDENNLKALCSSCHCKMDLKAMGRKKMLKREYYGQLRLF